MIRPMLAKAGDLPTGEGWQYEIKWDGWRGIATVVDGKVTIQSRSSKLDLTREFPRVAEQLETLPDCVLDGELAVTEAMLDREQGSPWRTSLEWIEHKDAAMYVVFDALEIAGVNLRGLPLVERRDALLEFVREFGPRLSRVAVSPAWDDGEQLLDYARTHELEGVVAKRKTSRYAEGTRTDAWTKVKITNEQEFVVAGYVPGKNGRSGKVGGLVLAYWDGPNLRYAGRTGNREAFDDQLHLTEISTCPVTKLTRPEARDVVWVNPELVVQVRFQRWTKDDRLAGPILLALRPDKPMEHVVREP